MQMVQVSERFARLRPMLYRDRRSHQGDQDTTKVGKRISFKIALSKVSVTGFIQCGRGMLRQRLPEHTTPTLDGGCVKPVAETFERALDMRFPTFVVS